MKSGLSFMSVVALTGALVLGTGISMTAEAKPGDRAKAAVETKNPEAAAQMEQRSAARQSAVQQKAANKCDTDGDGAVSQPEAQACAQTGKANAQAKAGEAKASCDTDGDGVLSQTESQVCGQAARSKAQATKADVQAQLSVCDTDANGSLSQAEAQACQASYDTNGDGIVTTDEVPAKQ